MKAIATYGGVLAVALAGAELACAQTYAAPSSEVAAVTGGSVYSDGGYYFGGGYHSSTAEEGVLTGLGVLRRATGEMNYFNSLASINGQEAYNRYLQNREKATETYFRMQQINRAAREAQRPQPLSFERYAALAKQQAPDELSDRQYDRTMGRLSWPALLRGEEFAAEREALDRAYMARTPSDAGAASAFHGYVWQLTQSMETKLRERVAQVSSAEYLASKTFLQSLSYESQQPLIVRAVASK